MYRCWFGVLTGKAYLSFNAVIISNLAKINPCFSIKTNCVDLKFFVIKATIGIFAQCLFENRLCTDLPNINVDFLQQLSMFHVNIAIVNKQMEKQPLLYFKFLGNTQ